MSILKINRSRLISEISTLATFSDAPAPAVTRILYSKQDQAARVWLREKILEAGLTIREDGLGNLFARWEGSELDLPAIGTGSHIDAIPYSGKFDGVVGVLGGLEAIRALKESGLSIKRSIELVMFTAEEPTRFGIGCLGSRAMAGTLVPNEIVELVDQNGHSLEELRQAAGFTDTLNDVQLPSDYYQSFIELHIEQGPRLEGANLQIGIVTSIAAPATLRAVLKGDGGHAGATLMPGRKDALVAASAIVQDVEKAALESDSPDSVATVGLLQVHPGAVNSIPSKVTMEIDIRDTQLTTRDTMVDRVLEKISKVCKQRDIGYEIDILNRDDPCQSGPSIIEAAEKVTKDLGYSYKMLVSRAYHDTLFMAKICPTAMIFVPSENGYSHRPEEFTADDDVVRGVEVLAHTMAKLSNQ
ncbi:MAG: M20 family metallo-hydrolase [Chloroflexota bacterium]